MIIDTGITLKRNPRRCWEFAYKGSPILLHPSLSTLGGDYTEYLTRNEAAKAAESVGYTLEPLLAGMARLMFEG